MAFAMALIRVILNSEEPLYLPSKKERKIISLQMYKYLKSTKYLVQQGNLTHEIIFPRGSQTYYYAMYDIYEKY